MAKKVTIKDIADMAGVSIATVSHVINRTRYVSPDLVEKIENIIIETGRTQTGCNAGISEGVYAGMGRENVIEVKFYDTVNDELLKFAVIISQSNGKWVFCKHKERGII